MAEADEIAPYLRNLVVSKQDTLMPSSKIFPPIFPKTGPAPEIQV